ncbi:uncharacterized protein TrAFT101_005849 [Trichoderma asperellum]|uniref:uncharacterized protein n=1 Tax=Trichoderma asperellum TaxID=101201 RepID=UPI003324E94D|nr:hypothetical protein TrAFT101_005849 [Trichoderma asperellum]
MVTSNPHLFDSLACFVFPPIFVYFVHINTLGMVAVPAHQLRLKFQSSGVLRSIHVGKRLYHGHHQKPTRLRHRPCANLATRLPAQTSIFIRPFVTSSSYRQTTSIGIEWYDLSPERKIQWLLDSGDTEWGWVIYRCTYKPELQGAWESFKNLVEYRTRKTIADSDAPDIAEKLDWAWVEDHELEGASLSELKRRFRAWVRADTQDSPCDIGATPYENISRYTYFIQVDEESLVSCLREAGVDLHGGHVNIVRGWAGSLPEEEMGESSEGLVTEDWMKIQASMVEPIFYAELYDDTWYTIYSPPPHVCVW